MVRRVTVVLACALLLAGCGISELVSEVTDVLQREDAPEGRPSGTSTTAPPVPSVLDLVDGVEGRFADGPSAALAFLYGLDHGYAPSRVVDAVVTGALDPDGGIIVGQQLSPPEGAPLRLIEDRPALEGTAAGSFVLAGMPVAVDADSSVTTDQVTAGLLALFDEQAERARAEEALLAEIEARERARLFIGSYHVIAVALLTEAGYSPSQITFAVVFGEEVRCGMRGVLGSWVELAWMLAAAEEYGDAAPFAGGVSCEIVGEDPELARLGAVLTCRETGTIGLQARPVAEIIEELATDGQHALVATLREQCGIEAPVDEVPAQADDPGPDGSVAFNDDEELCDAVIAGLAAGAGQPLPHSNKLMCHVELGAGQHVWVSLFADQDAARADFLDSWDRLETLVEGQGTALAPYWAFEGGRGIGDDSYDFADTPPDGPHAWVTTFRRGPFVVSAGADAQTGGDQASANGLATRADAVIVALLGG